jgi:hypothetical protein
VEDLQNQLEQARGTTTTTADTERVTSSIPQVAVNTPSSNFMLSISSRTNLLPTPPRRPLAEIEWAENAREDEEATDQATYGSPDPPDPIGMSYLGDASTLSFMGKLLGDDKQNKATRADMPCGEFDSRIISNQTHMWPQRFLGDRLVDCYMEFCHPQYPFIHETAFRRRYETMWTTKEPQDNIWTGTVNMVFALGSEFSPEMSLDIGQGFFRKVESLVTSELLTSRTLGTLQLLTLMAVYLQSTNSSDHAWNVVGVAVRQSQSLGLHLSKTIQSSKTPLECEMRKRAWWACFVLDSVSSIQMGRPNMIIEVLPSTDYPACVDDELILDEPFPVSNTSGKTIYSQESVNGQPSQMAFFLATIDLSRFMRDVLKTYNNPADQYLVMDIDRKMCEWMGKLPSHLRHDGDCPINPRLWRQKQVLTSRCVYG